MDVFTRFAWVVPINTKSAEETADAFNSIVIPAMRPRKLISDNGSEFKNHVFDEMCTAMDIKHKFCIPYHPQSDGMVERFNRSLVAMLKAYSNESGRNWPKFLPKVTAAKTTWRVKMTNNGLNNVLAVIHCVVVGVVNLLCCIRVRNR